MAAFTVNGTEIQAPKGANLLQALLGAGYKIPHYCYHPSLSVDGTCRMCFVQMEGDPRLHVSCNMKVADGLKILTETDTIHEARQGMMEFLLVNHPLDCPVCDKGGECMLQRYSMDHGIGEARMGDQRRRYPKPQFDPLIDLERNRCILCSRCVRFCDEIAEDHVLGIVERGDRNRIASFGNGPISSIYSGNVVDLCPVGALTSKPFRFHARTWEMQQIVTSCVHCSTGCSMTAWTRDGKVLRVTTPVVRKDDAYALNEDTSEFICNMGRFASDFGHSESRLAGPAAGAVVEAAKALKSVAEKYGPDSVAFIAGPRATNEELFLLQKIAREGIGTNNIDWRLQLASAEACSAHSAAMAASDGTLEDLQAVDCVLVVEADLSATTPILALKVKEAAKRGFNKTILLGSVVDGFVGKYAAQSIVRTVGQVHALLEKVASDAPSNGDAESNQFLETLKGSSSGMIILGLSEQSGMMLPSLVPQVLRLKQALGWKMMAVPAERNAFGAFAAGCQPDRLPGQASGKKGLSAPEILKAAGAGQIKALYVLGQDLMDVCPDAAALKQDLAPVETLIVQDLFPGTATANASVVIPGALFTEKDGSYVNVDGSLGRLVKGNDAPNGIWSDVQSLSALAVELGVNVPQSPNELFGAFMAAVDPQASITLEDLTCDQPGEEWPVRVKADLEPKPRFGYRLRHAEAAQLESQALPSWNAAPDTLAARWTFDVTRPEHLTNQSPTMSRLRQTAACVYMNTATASDLGFIDGQNVLVSCEGFEAVGAVLHVHENVAEGLLHVPANDFPAAMLCRPLVVRPAAE